MATSNKRSSWTGHTSSRGFDFSSGDIDAATCGFGSKEAWWFTNDGKGHFKNHLFAGRGSKNVVWYESPLNEMGPLQ